MGQRPARKQAPPPAHSHQPEQRQISVDPNRIINMLRQQRADLQAQLDFVTAALEESHEKEQQMLQRIAELEDKET